MVRELQRDRSPEAAYAALSRQSADAVLIAARDFVARHYGQELKKKSDEPDDILVRFVQRFATPERDRSLSKATAGTLAILKL